MRMTDQPIIRLPRAVLYHRPGDLVFCRDGGVLSRALRLGQLYLDRLQADFSHVAICVYPGLLMHSVPGGGVQFLPVENPHPEQIVFNVASTGGSAIVLRPPYADVPALTTLRAMLYWVGQKYNFAFRRPISSAAGRAYCSQLVVQILRRLGYLDDSVFADLRVTPSALFRYVQERGALDVTEGYRTYERLLVTDRTERYRLGRDIPRAQIMRSAVLPAEQAVIRRAVSDTAARTTITNALGADEISRGIRALPGNARALDTILEEANAHMFGSSLVLEILGAPEPEIDLNYVEMRKAPVAAVSGMAMHGMRFDFLFEDIAGLTDHLATLQFALVESLESPAGVVSHVLCGAILDALTMVADAPHREFRRTREHLESQIEQLHVDHHGVVAFVQKLSNLFLAYDDLIDHYRSTRRRMQSLIGAETGVAPVMPSSTELDGAGGDPETPLAKEMERGN